MSTPRSTYFTEDIVLTPPPTLDRWGTPIADSIPVTLKGSIDYGYRRVTDLNGNEIIANCAVEIDDRTLNVEDTLTFDGSTHSIISWRKIGKAGYSFLRVYVR